MDGSIRSCLPLQKEELQQQSRAERLAEVESLLALLASRTEVRPRVHARDWFRLVCLRS